MPRTYVGYTEDVSARLLRHNAGKVAATKNWAPWKIIHTESAATMSIAKQREQYWKSGAGRRKLKKYFDWASPLK